MQNKIVKLYLPVKQFHTISKKFTKSAVTRIKPLQRCRSPSPSTSIGMPRWISNQLDDKDPSLAWKSSGKTFNEGPDQILPSTSFYTWENEGATRINYGDCEAGKSPPISIPTFLKNQVENIPNNLAIAVKINGTWKKWTFEKYYEDIITVAKGFLALGLERQHSVCILSFNRPEWFLSNFGAILAGGISSGIYVTNNPEAVAHCASDGRADILVVENEEQLAKVKRIQNQLQLKSIVLIDGESEHKDVITWTKLMDIGRAESDETLRQRLRTISINQCSCLIYTSGTTGKPKGVMLSHDNLTWTSQTCTNTFVDYLRKETSLLGLTVVSYLPLSHIAAQIVDLYIPLSIPEGIATYFADKDSLKGTLVDTLREVKPTIFLSVPRVYEKIYDRICEVRAKNSGLKKLIADVAKARAATYNRRRINGEAEPWVPGFKLCEKIIFNKLKEQLGFENIKLFTSGAAPLSPDIIEFFLSLNIPIAQLYGLSETSGPCTSQCLDFFKVGSIGKVLPGAKAYVLSPTSEGIGEVIVGGRCVMMGYNGLKDVTTKAFLKGNDFLTGDIGSIDEKGFITLGGRQKEIIITSGGENVAPVEIENRIKSELAVVSNAVIIGEGQKCLSLLLTLKTQLDPETNEPTEMLTEFVQDWISVNSSLDAKVVGDILGPAAVDSEHELRKAIQRRIDKVNAKAISNAQQIRNWCILPADFSLSGGELGPSLKLIRSVVNTKYENIIQELYKSPNAVDSRQ